MNRRTVATDRHPRYFGVYRIVEERGLASFANNCRWNSLFAGLMAQRVRARLKHVACTEISPWASWIVPAQNYLEVLSAGPVHFREIEWLDFDCTGSALRADELVAVVHEAKLTTEAMADFVRVFGYR